MCAIIGWKGTVNNALVRSMVRLAEDSGPMSTGLMAVNGPTVEWWKRAVSASYALRNHNHIISRLSEGQMGVGHTRYATHGAINDTNAHPFQFGEGLFFVHNGVISNYRQITPHAVVDSECLGPLIVDRNIGRADGSVGTAWFEVVDNTWKMFIYRHWQSLSACVVEGEQPLVIVGSRQHHIPGSIRQNPRTKWLHLEEGTAYEVTATGLEPAWSNEVGRQRNAWSTHVGGVYVGG
jgi:hypothetical protein